MDREGCEHVSGLLGPFLDDELDPASFVRVETHLPKCVSCREHVAFHRALRVSLKRQSEHRAPEALRARLEAAFAAERESTSEALVVAAPSSATKDAGESHEMVPTVSVLPAIKVLEQEEAWPRKAMNVARTWLPVSAAAAALLFAWSSRQSQQSNDTRLVPRGVLSDLVAEHSHPLPPERTEPGEVRALERYVGVPLHLPFSRAERKARLVGGRVLPVRNERAAMLQYEMDQGGGTPQRVSVFIYDPSRIKVDGEELNAQGPGKVRVGRTNGYSVAVMQHEGVGYAFTADLGPEAMAELVRDVE